MQAGTAFCISCYEDRDSALAVFASLHPREGKPAHVAICHNCIETDPEGMGVRLNEILATRPPPPPFDLPPRPTKLDNEIFARTRIWRP